jgi:hypothetical protein
VSSATNPPASELSGGWLVAPDRSTEHPVIRHFGALDPGAFFIENH